MEARTRRLFRLFFLTLLFSPVSALPSGFSINEQGAKAIGMGGAFVAQADDPSAVYYNPAGIVQLEGTRISAGTSVFLPRASFVSDRDDPLTGSFAGKKTDAGQKTFVIPHFHFTHKLNDRFSMGLGGFSNFGLCTEWPQDWELRYVTGGTKAEVTSFSVNPVLAFRPVKRLSISAGPVFHQIDITLENKQFTGIPGPAGDLNARLTGDDRGWGWNAGMLVWITDDVKLGASYRSRLSHSIRGRLEFTPEAPDISPFFTGTGADADLTLPEIAYAGLAWKIGRLTLEFDVQWTGWSSFDRLEARLENGGIITRPKSWNDVYAYRFGAEYRLGSAWALRAGIIFDESPVPDETLDPLVPSGDRLLYTFGTGFRLGGFTADIAYNYLADEARAFDNRVGEAVGKVTGRFEDGYAHILSLSLAWHF